MTGTFVRLKLTLLGNTLRKSVWQTIGVVLGLVSALGVVAGATAGAVWGGWNHPQVTGDVLVVLGSAAVLAWMVVPLFLFGVDATLDPQHFALYPISRRKLLTGLAFASLVTVPGAATVLALLGVSLAWLRHPAVLVVALLGALGALALCIVGSRALTTALSPLMESRRWREILTIAAFIPIMAISPLFTWFGNQMEHGITTDPDAFDATWNTVLNVLGWTPFGAPWGAAAAAYAGHWVEAIGRLAVVALTVGLLWVWWGRALTRALENPRARASTSPKAVGLGFFNRLPATPTGAVAARYSTYYFRDPRYMTSLIAIPTLALSFFIVSRVQAEAAMTTLLTAPMVAWLLGFSLSNDIGSDYTAFALHVATGLPGRADRWGRALPVLAIGIPVLIALAVFGVWSAGMWPWLPTVLGVSLGLLAASAGISSATSARWVYPVPKPGDSPFKNPQGAAGATMVAQFINMGLVALVSLPGAALIVPTILAYLGDLDDVGLPFALGALAAVVSLGIGIAVLIVGVRIGGRWVDQRGPELLQKVMSFA